MTNISGPINTTGKIIFWCWTEWGWISLNKKQSHDKKSNCAAYLFHIQTVEQRKTLHLFKLIKSKKSLIQCFSALSRGRPVLHLQEVSLLQTHLTLINSLLSGCGVSLKTGVVKEEHPPHNKPNPANCAKIRVRVQLKGGSFHDLTKSFCVASIKRGSDIKNRITYGWDTGLNLIQQQMVPWLKMYNVSGERLDSNNSKTKELKIMIIIKRRTFLQLNKNTTSQMTKWHFFF